MTYRNYLRRRKIEVSDALISLCPNSSWSVDDTYESIENYWSEDYPLPTKKEIEDEMERLQKISDDLEYQRQRIPEYGNWKDQLNLLYDDIKSGNLENGKWVQMIEEVKARHPKPE